jgi:soluble P-type ATPase
LISIDIPDFGRLEIEHVVLDYNGTLAVDGELIPGVLERFERLAPHCELHVVTADTFGRVADTLAQAPCSIRILKPGAQDRAKLQFVEELGAARTVAIGNGRNDRLMLAAAALGIAVMLDEGVASATLAAADVLVKSIHDALDLLLEERRLVATLRS